jgi:hypothetical protein
VSERPMIIGMTTTSRPQQRYDHRLRDIVQRTRDLTIATDLGVPRSTALGWLAAAPTVVVSLEVVGPGNSDLSDRLRVVLSPIPNSCRVLYTLPIPFCCHSAAARPCSSRSSHFVTNSVSSSVR